MYRDIRYAVELRHPLRQREMVKLSSLETAPGTRPADAFLALIREIVQSGSRWHVVACIRKFDLRYSRDLQDLFPRCGINIVTPQFEDPTGRSCSTVAMPISFCTWRKRRANNRRCRFACLQPPLLRVRKLAITSCWNVFSYFAGCYYGQPEVGRRT